MSRKFIRDEKMESGAKADANEPSVWPRTPSCCPVAVLVRVDSLELGVRKVDLRSVFGVLDLDGANP